MNDTIDRYRRVAADFLATAEAVAPDAWSNPSPCPDFDARAIVAHVVGLHARLLGEIGHTLRPAAAVAEAPVDALRAAIADVQAFLDDPATAEATYVGAFGPTRVIDTADRFVCFDLVVHRWDLAKATGQDDRLDPAEVARVMATAEGFGEVMRRPGIIGPAADPGPAPSDQDRLLAYLGRSPSWPH